MALDPENAVRVVWREKIWNGVKVRKSYFVFPCIECTSEIQVANSKKDLGKHHGRCKSCSSSRLIRSGGCAAFTGLLRYKRLRPFESLFNNVRRVAALSQREFTLTFEQFLEFTKIKECHYCGSVVPWSPYNVYGTRNSRPYNLDRKNNALGYAAANLVVCCGWCNYVKSDQLTYEEMMILSPAMRLVAAARQTSQHLVEDKPCPLH